MDEEQGKTVCTTVLYQTEPGAPGQKRNTRKVKEEVVDVGGKRNIKRSEFLLEGAKGSCPSVAQIDNIANELEAPLENIPAEIGNIPDLQNLENLADLGNLGNLDDIQRIASMDPEQLIGCDLQKELQKIEKQLKGEFGPGHIGKITKNLRDIAPLDAEGKFQDKKKPAAPPAPANKSKNNCNIRIPMLNQNIPTPTITKRPEQTLSDFRDEAVITHNYYRALHRVAPLELSEDLCIYAQRWAEKLVSSGDCKHSPCLTEHGKFVGENIAAKTSEIGSDYTGKSVTDYWYSEIEDYKYFGAEPPTQLAGHFTQIIWKDSENIGIGRAYDELGRVVVVASYYPAGNLEGKYTKNIIARI